MFIGSYPVADSLDGDDIMIISKDGVHLLQITAQAAGFGGGLKWWIETETSIYREYPAQDLGFTYEVLVGEGKPWETMAYKFVDTYYREDLINQVGMLSSLEEPYTQPKNENGKIMARKARDTETPDNCGPWTMSEVSRVFVPYLGTYPGDVNIGSRAGWYADITCQKSDNYPCVAIAGCNVYSVSEEHLIKNFPNYATANYARYMGDWGIIPSVYPGVIDPHYNEPTAFANGELTSLGEKYGSSKWSGVWNPQPLDHHENIYREIGASQFSWQAYIPELPNEMVYGGDLVNGGGVWRRYAVLGSEDDPQAKWNTFSAIDWSKDNLDIAGAFDEVFDLISSDIASVEGVLEAATDDKAGAIHALLNVEQLSWNGKGTHGALTQNEAWNISLDGYNWNLDFYEINFEICSPFAFATEHEEPFIVACNTYGYGVPIPNRDVDNFDRSHEYSGYDVHSHYPYGSNINAVGSWKLFNDPIHDPGGSSGNWRIDVDHDETEYFGYWTDDTANRTGLYDVTVDMPFGFNYTPDYSYDVALFPTHKGWFDKIDGIYTRKSGYRNTEYGSLQSHFSITDFNGATHTYPDYVYDSEGREENAYQYLSFYHPYSANTYDYRVDTIEPSENYVKDIRMGYWDAEEGKIHYDYSLDDHWIFNKRFLEENLVEHTYTDTDTYEIVYKVYDDDITHEVPNPDYLYTIRIHRLKICKGFTSKQGTGQKAQERARTSFSKFLKTAKIGVLEPKFVSTDGDVSRITSIGVNDEEGFFTGYLQEVDDPDNPGNTKKEIHKRVWIDPDTGNINTEGTYLINGDSIFEKLQRKLVAGDGIAIREDAQTGKAIIRNTMLDVTLDVFAEHAVCNYGLDIQKTGDDIYFSLRHDVVAAEPPEDAEAGTYIPVVVERSYNQYQNKIIDTLSVDINDLHIPTIETGHGITDTGSGSLNQHIINSTALDNIKVNGVLQQRQADADIGNYVDLQIEGGGGEAEQTYAMPVPNYGERSIITTFRNVSDTFTPETDGYLFLEVRNNALFYVEVSIEGKNFTFGNMNMATNRQSVNDCSNMLPIMKGQKVTLYSKSSSPAINTSESASNANKFWFIPAERQKLDTGAFVYPRVLYDSTGQVATFRTENLPVSSGEPYILTPDSDGVILSYDYYSSASNAGYVSICPLGENDTSLSEYRIFQIPSSPSNTVSNQYTMFPVKKGSRYKIFKSYSGMTDGVFTVYKYATVAKPSTATSPFLDWSKAETISITLNGTNSWVNIPSPQVTDRPGIMYIDGDLVNSSTDGIFCVKVRCNSSKTISLTYRNNDANRNYCIMNKFSEGSVASLKWQYYDSINNVNPVKLVFVPFKEYTLPGIDYAIDNKYNLLNNAGMLDLSEIFNRLEALESVVFPQ